MFTLYSFNSPSVYELIYFRYILTVIAKIADITLSVSSQVVVVEGDPPLFNLPLLSTPVNPSTPVTIHATEANLLQGCLIQWESLPLVGYTTINTDIVSKGYK